MREWHDEHSLFALWTASISLSVGSWSLKALFAASRAGMFGGGGGTGVPRIFSSTDWPRFTGDVRVGLELTVSTGPSVRTPPRRLPSPSVTSLIDFPVTPGMP